MLNSLYRNNDLFSSRFEKMNTDQSDVDKQYSVFHDYLGLINLIQPVTIPSPLDSPTESVDSGSVFDYPFFLEKSSRHRMNSLDSDAISDSSSSGGSRSESEMLFDSLSSSGDILPYRQTTPSTIADNVLTQTYAKTLETIIATQTNALNRFAAASNKDTRNAKSANKASVCVFCRNNGESREFYSSHTLKDNEGNTTCPILRAYTCPLCKANGDNSHTIKYCPKYTPKLKTDKLLGITL